MAHSQPYIYAAPQRYSAHEPWGNNFDPKAYTRASWAPKPPPAPKPKGPLINFNRHPDSYSAVPYGQTTWKPLPAGTKKFVVVVRWIQLLIRFLGFWGAVGALCCVAFMKNVADEQSLLIRIPPAVDVLASAYAVWHLARPASGRTPASSASYHMFASLADVCLIPFYIYISLLDRNRLALPMDSKERWTSIFNSIGTEKLLLATWILAIGVAGLHAAGLGFSILLALAFRKIAELPPDMNPLEDNLTSRHSIRHKYKGSESSNRTSMFSTASTPRDSMVKDTDERNISFLKTRNESATELYNPHNPRSAEQYRASVASNSSQGTLFEQVAHAQINQSQGNHNVRAESPLKHSSVISYPTSSRPQSAQSTLAGDATQTPFVPRKSSKRVSNSNWAVLEDSSSEHEYTHDDDTIPRMNRTVYEHDHSQAPAQTKGPYHSLRQRPAESAPLSPVISDIDDREGGDLSLWTSPGLRHSWQENAPLPLNTTSRPPWRKSYAELQPGGGANPLALNPVTPPLSVHEFNTAPSERTLSLTSGNSYGAPSNGSRNGNGNGHGGGNTPKGGKKYGDLQSALSGIRTSPHTASKPKLTKGRSSPGVPSSDWFAKKERAPPASTSSAKANANANANVNPNAKTGTRVISRSGVDLSDAPLVAYDDWDEDSIAPGYGGNGLRQVSGKIAEEGLGGWARRRVSGRMPR